MATKLATKPAATAADRANIGAAGERLAKELEELRVLEKSMKARKDQLEDQLRALLGDAHIGTVKGVDRVKLVPGTNSSTDREALKRGWPEAWQSTTRVTSYTWVKVV